MPAAAGYYTKKQKKASRARMLSNNSWSVSNRSISRRFQSRRQGLVGGPGRSGGILQHVTSLVGALVGRKTGGRGE